jgi:MoaA/NifB/PqqE/SkfB family radical SAM enzyme
MVPDVSVAAAESPRRSSLLQRLPLLTLYLSERCNSRCVSCDYWRHGHADMDRGAVQRLLPSLADLRTEVVLISGGEPLLNPEWADIAELLRAHGLKLWLLTSGLSLAKHARRVAELFAAVTVSLDGTDRETYAAIRGLDAFDKVCEGIRAVAGAGPQINVRTTLQRANFRQMPAFVDLARQLGVGQISFLAVDVANSHAFGRASDFDTQLALQPEDLPVFEQVLDRLEEEHAAAFRSGLIAESPQKLRRLLQYFRAIHGLAAHPPVRCNAPEFSAVVDANGHVRPCFFIPGPDGATLSGGALPAVLNGGTMPELRETIRAGARPECATCVCPLWRDFQRGDKLIPSAQPLVSTAALV